MTRFPIRRRLPRLSRIVGGIALTSTLPLILTLALPTTAAQADVVAVVSAKSPITTMSKGEAADIFLGKPSPLAHGIRAVPIDQAEGAAARDAFYVKILGKSPAQLKAYWSKIIFTGRGQPPATVPNDLDMKKRIAADPLAIGYVEATSVDASLRILF
jgi:hypothetical protein